MLLQLENQTKAVLKIALAGHFKLSERSERVKSRRWRRCSRGVIINTGYVDLPKNSRSRSFAPLENDPTTRGLTYFTYPHSKQTQLKSEIQRVLSSVGT
jgi:hypothetical protein